LISFRSGKVIKSKLNTSRSGRHGVRQYILLPGKYLAYRVYRSNLGNTYISVGIIQIKEDGSTEELQRWSLFEGKEEKMLLNDLPNNIRQMLMDNKDQLPLFYYVLDQDQSE
jgi:hypothetical protein